MKHLLQKILGDAHLTCEELVTVLIHVESSLNSRPITSMSFSTNDLSTLILRHFLIGDLIWSIPEPDLSLIAINLTLYLAKMES